MTDYEYDVFVSYNRNTIVTEWLDRHFLPLFSGWLHQDLGRKERIFLDRNSIQVGQLFEDRILGALTQSKCLVPIWAPPYFSSAWCCAEWETFRKREGHIPDSNPCLVVPIQWHDGEHYPASARQLQAADFREHTFVSEGYRKSEGYPLFEAKVKAFAASVVAVLRRAPKYDPKWPVVHPSEVHPLRLSTIPKPIM